LGCRKFRKKKGLPRIYKLNREKKKWERFSRATAERLTIDGEGKLWAVNRGMVFGRGQGKWERERGTPSNVRNIVSGPGAD